MRSNSKKPALGMSVLIATIVAKLMVGPTAAMPAMTAAANSCTKIGSNKTMCQQPEQRCKCVWQDGGCQDDWNYKDQKSRCEKLVAEAECTQGRSELLESNDAVCLWNSATSGCEIGRDCSIYDSECRCNQASQCFWLSTLADDRKCVHIDDKTVQLNGQEFCGMFNRSRTNCERPKRVEASHCNRCVWSSDSCKDEWDHTLQKTICMKESTALACEQVRNEEHLRDVACSWHQKPDANGSEPSPHCVIASDSLGTKESRRSGEDKNVECCSIRLTCSIYKTACQCEQITPGCRWNATGAECLDDDLEDPEDPVDGMFEDKELKENAANDHFKTWLYLLMQALVAFMVHITLL